MSFVVVNIHNHTYKHCIGFTTHFY